MQEQNELRVEGVVDHIAVKTEDMQADVREYERLGFRVETLYEDWAMLRDARGFGVALLPEGSKHPQHIGIRVEVARGTGGGRAPRRAPRQGAPRPLALLLHQRRRRPCRRGHLLPAGL